jgi:hypothetical protein
MKAKSWVAVRMIAAGPVSEPESTLTPATASTITTLIGATSPMASAAGAIHHGQPGPSAAAAVTPSGRSGCCGGGAVGGGGTLVTTSARVGARRGAAGS